MDRRSFAAAVALGSAAALFGARQASAAPPSDSLTKARNVVLVHGAYADGSCWSDVIPLPAGAGAERGVGAESAAHAGGRL